MLRILDYAERLLLILLAAPFLIAFGMVLPRHPEFILFVAPESLAVALILIRRQGEISVSPYAFFVAIMGTAMPLLVRPNGGIPILPDQLTLAVMLTGIALSVSAKIFLNRSFGLVAANRGIKRRGPYRLLRHPMYLGYILTEAGFLLAGFSTANLLAFALGWTFQILRIHEEEKMLMRDSAYCDYASAVRWRLVPGAF